MAGQHFVRHDPERILIRRGFRRLRVALLGTHVRRRSDDDAGMFLRFVLVFGDLRDTEIGHDRVALAVDEDVRRLDVAVDHVPPVGVVQRAADHEQESAHHRDRQRPGGADDVLERPPVYEFHHEVVQIVVVADAVDRDDVRVIERGDRSRLLLEALDHPLPGQERRATSP